MRGAGRDLPEKRVAPTERRLDDEMKRVVWEDALAGHRALHRGAVGPLADERIRRGGRRIFCETDEHRSIGNSILLVYTRALARDEVHVLARDEIQVGAGAGERLGDGVGAVPK